MSAGPDHAAPALAYRPEIDGLRAIAVLPVILFHAGLELLSGGFVGVDVFFVISGYLITGIILREMAEGRFSLLRFYERRARRILPALFLVMACTVPAAWLILPPAGMQDYAESLVAVTVFASNILFWAESGYFSAAAELKPMLHTWSLAVEEQFYILFPLLLMATWRLGVARIFAILSGLLALSLVAAEWGARNAEWAAFYLLPFRAWELLLGSLVAIHLHRTPTRPSGPRNGLLAGIGLAMIVWAVFAFDRHTPFPGLHALAPTLGTALIILFATEGTFVHRVLSLRGFVGVGLISYSAYLWHQPILAFYKSVRLDVSAAEIPALLAVVLVLAWLSWRFVERPFRNSSAIPAAQVFRLSAVGLTSLAAVGAVLTLEEGHEGRRTYPDFRIEIASYDHDNDGLRYASWSILQEVTGTRAYKVVANRADFVKWFPPDSPKTKLLLVGDSRSKDLYNLLHFSQRARETLDIARFGVEIAGLEEAFWQSPNYRHADIVLFASRYTDEDIEALDRILPRLRADSKRVGIARRMFEFPEFRGKKLALADYLVLTEVWSGNTDPVRISELSDRLHFEAFASGKTEPAVVRTGEAIDRLAERHPWITVLDRMDHICDRAARRCLSLSAELEKSLYDYGHHTLAGARAFGARVDGIGWLDPLIGRPMGPRGDSREASLSASGG